MITISVSNTATLPDIRIEDDWLLIEVRYPYHIQLKRLNEPWKLERWIEHLQRTGWMTDEHLATVVELVEGYFTPKKGPWLNKTTPPHAHYLP